MNSKLAKRLRQQAGGNTAIYSNQGTPRIYQTVHAYPVLVAKGTPRKLSPTCTRYTYQQLKRTI